MSASGGGPNVDMAACYRQRFESSVLGHHAMMPETEEHGEFLIANTRADGKVQAPCPSGPDTSFATKTPMPYRFTPDSVPSQSATHKSLQKASDHPIYSTSAADIGRLQLGSHDQPMRWYGLRGEFTSKFYLSGANPKAQTNSGLNTAMDRSGVHHTQDQGWSGGLGLKDHNVGSLSYARARQRGR